MSSSVTAAHRRIRIGEFKIQSVGDRFDDRIAAEGCAADGRNVDALGRENRVYHAALRSCEILPVVLIGSNRDIDDLTA